jgi:hypothetical protein
MNSYPQRLRKQIFLVPPDRFWEFINGPVSEKQWW